MIRTTALVSVALLLGLIPGTLVVKECVAWPEYGGDVNSFCPSQPYMDNNCSLCHGATRSEPTDAKDAFLAGDLCFFCPNDAPCTTGPTCTDLDQDGYAQEGGECGPEDCDDTDAAVNPEAVEDCTDGVDNDCNGLVDAADPNAVGCPPACTDADGDLYSVEGGDCGPVDCDDTNATVNPGAVEDCTDGVDNNCNGMVDAADPNAVGCPPPCTDADGDLYSVGGGDCGPVDCDDTEASIHPGAVEDCTDGIDNNCNGLVDGDDPYAVGCVADCTDVDGDLYSIDGGDCGPVDCDDADESIHPGATENCTDGIDNNCDGLVDAADPNAAGCPAGCTDADGDLYSVEGGDCGPVDCDDADASVNPGATEDCTDGIDNDCNGLVDTADPNAVGCPAGCTDADGDLYSVEGGDCGPADCDDANASVNPGTTENCIDGVDNNCNGKIDRQDTACTSDERDDDCEGGRGFDRRGHRECDDEERHDEDSWNRGDDGEHHDEGSRRRDEGGSDDGGDVNRQREHDSVGGNAGEDQNASDLKALLDGTAPVGCSVAPESMGPASPGSLLFMYPIVAGYIGLVRRIARRKTVSRKDRT